MPRVSHDLFVLAWEASDSLTQVSVRMTRRGHPLSPEQCYVLAWAVRALGTDLKVIERSKLPDFREPSTSPAPPLKTGPVERCPDSPVPDELGGRFASTVSKVGGFAPHYLADRWQHREGSLG